MAYFHNYREGPAPSENSGSDWIDDSINWEKHSKYEKMFADLWVKYYPEIDLYHQVRISDDTTHKFDFAHIPSRTAIEIDGGTRMGKGFGGSHGGGKNYFRDMMATYLGWSVLRITSEQLKKIVSGTDELNCLQLVVAIIEFRTVQLNKLQQST